MTHAYLCEGLRTPIGRFGGALAQVRPDDMLAHVLRQLMDPHGGMIVDEVFAGCANQAGEDNRNVARMASLLAGLPDLVEHEKVVSPALIVIGEVTARDDVALAVAAQEAAR